jgi:hypothetical protein
MWYIFGPKGGEQISKAILRPDEDRVWRQRCDACVCASIVLLSPCDNDATRPCAPALSSYHLATTMRRVRVRQHCPPITLRQRCNACVCVSIVYLSPCDNDATRACAPALSSYHLATTMRRVRVCQHCPPITLRQRCDASVCASIVLLSPCRIGTHPA